MPESLLSHIHLYIVIAGSIRLGRTDTAHPFRKLEPATGGLIFFDFFLKLLSGGGGSQISLRKASIIPSIIC